MSNSSPPLLIKERVGPPREASAEWGRGRFLLRSLLNPLGFGHLAPLISAAKSARRVRAHRFGALGALGKLGRRKRKMRRAAALVRRCSAMAW